MGAAGGFLLATSTVCPKCGFANQPGFQFCSNCGSPLAVAPAAAPAAAPYGAPPPASPPPGYPAPYGYGPSPWEYERTKQVDRTKTGILLLLIGSLLSWVPIVNFIGDLLLFVGAILVILGRKAFGDKHSRNVIISLVMFIIGIIAAIAVGVAFVLAFVSSAFTGTGPTPAEVQSAFNVYLIGEIIVAVILGIAEVLFIYALQAQTGKLVLWGAFGASIALQAAIAVIVAGAVSTALAAIASGGTVTQTTIDSLTAQASGLAYLSVIPALLFALADYLAWSRINKGEIPAPVQAPMYPGMPPPPPMPPR